MPPSTTIAAPPQASSETAWGPEYASECDRWSTARTAGWCSNGVCGGRADYAMRYDAIRVDDNARTDPSLAILERER